MSGYENYTLSPVPWIKQMPEHWGLVRGKNLYQKMQRPTSDTDNAILFSKDSELFPKRGSLLKSSYCSSVGLFGKIWAISYSLRLILAFGGLAVCQNTQRRYWPP